MTKEEVISKLQNASDQIEEHASLDQDHIDAIRTAISMLSKQPAVEVVKHIVKNDDTLMVSAYLLVKVNGHTIHTFYDWQDEEANDLKEELIEALGIERSDT